MLFFVEVVTKCQTALVQRCCWVQRLLQLVNLLETLVEATVDCIETGLQVLDQTATVNFVETRNENFEQCLEQTVQSHLLQNVLAGTLHLLILASMCLGNCCMA